MTVAVVCNPAKVDDVDTLQTEIAKRCADLGLGEPLWFETTVEDPGAGMATQALAAEAHVVIVCGGDGTVTACAGTLCGSDVPMAVVPAGTGNLLARNLGLPLEQDAALDVAFGHGRRRIDVLEAGGKRFLAMAGLGFDAALIDSTDEKLKGRFGWVAYVAGAVRALRDSRAVPTRVVVDDRTPLRRKALGVLVGNVGQLQGGLTLLPDAVPDDGILDVIVLRPRGVLDWLSLVRRGLRSGPPQGVGPATDVLRGRRVHILTDTPLALEFDGDVAGETAEMSVSVIEGGLVVCCPEER